MFKQFQKQYEIIKGHPNSAYAHIMCVPLMISLFAGDIYFPRTKNWTLGFFLVHDIEPTYVQQNKI